MHKNKNLMGYGILIVINLLICFLINGMKFDLSIPLVYEGDFIPTIALFKEIMTNELGMIGIPTTKLMSAPGILEFGDFPTPIMAVWLFIKMISAFTNDYFIAINIFVLFTFILNPLSMYFILRIFRVNLLIAIVIATLYNVLPFHYLRLGHTLYIGYFLLPILTYILLLLLAKKPLFYKFSNILGIYKFDFSKKNIFIIIILLFSSTWNYYYTFFFLFLVGVVFLIHCINQKNRYFFYSSLLIVVLSVLPFFINMIPYKLYSINHGKNMQVGERLISESEIYGLKITQLLLPVDNHRLKLFSEIKDTYNRSAPLITENGSATLGIIGSLGFLLLLLYLLVDVKNTSILKKISYLNVSSLLFATIGGFGSLFALLVSPSIRGYNRISILIATFSLIAFALMINYLIKRYRIGFWKVLIISLMILICGLYDQISRGIGYKPNQNIEILFNSDKEFIKKIENLHAKDEIGMIMQYPYISYPESIPIVKMSAYDQLIGYLHSDTLRWSYGAVKGRETEKWISTLQSQPIDEQIKILKSSGFSGIYIDRRGYKDNGEKLESLITEYLETKPFISKDKIKVFFKFKATSHKVYKFNYPPDFFNFYIWEGEIGKFRWARKDAFIQLHNNKEEDIIKRITFQLGSLNNRNMTIKHNNKIVDSFNIIPGINLTYTYSLKLIPGKNIINFDTDGDIVVPIGLDNRTLLFSLGNFKFY